jgi:hypothetical protein
MAAFGVQQAEIATLIACDPKTLRKYYRHELDIGATEANVRVARSLFNMATKERNVAAQIFWLKARAGWREPPRDANVGGTGTPVATHFTWAPVVATRTDRGAGPRR